MSLFCQRFDDRNERYSVVVEDDGRVAFAYLYDLESIISDVWLYNRTMPSEVPDWKFGIAKAPFQNPPEFVAIPCCTPVDDDSRISTRWFWNDEETLKSVDVLFDEIVYGRMGLSTKPGWAKLAKKDGPLAKVLREERA